MKRPLGRGLENLMSSAGSDERPSSESSEEFSESPVESRSGVERLIQGNRQLELGQTPEHEARPFSQSVAPQPRLSQVPSWIFYLADLVLMSAVVWMVILSPEPMTRNQTLVCFALVVMAASVGLWPWLRNVLYCGALGEAKKLPKWVVADNVEISGETKQLVVHLQKPAMAVEVTETSWNGVNTKPYWLDGPPNLPPGGVKALLEEAEAVYLQERQVSAPSKVSASDPVEV